ALVVDHLADGEIEADALDRGSDETSIVAPKPGVEIPLRAERRRQAALLVDHDAQASDLAHPEDPVALAVADSIEDDGVVDGPGPRQRFVERDRIRRAAAVGLGRADGVGG